MDKDKAKKILQKALSLEQGKNVALAKEFIEIEEKLEGIKENTNEKIGEISLELKKKLESELVLEINREELKGDQGEKGERGEKGDTGNRGMTGKNGKDGRDGRDGRDGVDADEQNILEALQELVPLPKDGSPDTPEEIVIKLQTLKGEKRLDAKAIKNLPKFTREVIREMGAHGGAYETPIKAGSGISISKDAFGAYVITSTGGSGLTKETPSGTIDDANVTFTVAHEPFFINVNGAIYNVGDGLYASYVAGTITLTFPVGTGGFIKSYY